MHEDGCRRLLDGVMHICQEDGGHDGKNTGMWGA